MGTFRMPSLGADMEAGTLVDWLKHPGDEVRRGDVIAVVETQKGAIEVEVFEDGIVDELLVEEGATVPVGTPLARLRAAGEAPAAPAAAEKAAEAPAPEPAEAAAAPGPAQPIAPPPRGERPRASPAARKLAEERGIDLAKLSGSGPGGAVVRADVEAAAGAEHRREAPPARRRGVDAREMRRAIAAAMARSKREIPHYYLATTIDLEPALAFLEATNTERPPAQRLLPAAVLLKAVALALRKLPEFNGFYSDGGFRPGERIHLGTAVAIRGGGLVAPAIHDADRKDLGEIMAAMRDLVARVRAGGIRSSELSDPTITVSSLGERGVEVLYAVITPPQVAIIGFGAPVERPWVVDGALAPRRVVTATLSADHRVSDGHRGALLLAEIDRLLQEPGSL